MSIKRERILAMVVMGTRPEALKLAPIVGELQRRRKEFRLSVCATAQHRELLDQVVKLYRIPVDYDLDIMRKDQGLEDTAARALVCISDVLRRASPDVVIVQGDTTTTFVASLAAFYHKIPVAHIEAGLRTHDRFAPFPEEMHRRLTTQVADFHYAATPWAQKNLLRDGVSKESIEVTGNTIVDTFVAAANLVRKHPPVVQHLHGLSNHAGNVIVVTAHRRENFGVGIKNICRALQMLVEQHKDVQIVFPVHPNPNVRETVFGLLRNVERIYLIPPLEYLQFVWLMNRAYLVLTDSGGIQEEVPSLGKPVLVMRDNTERPEGIETGVCRLVGTHPDTIFDTVSNLLEDSTAYHHFRTLRNPFGDGRASARIVDSLARRLMNRRETTAHNSSIS